MWFFKMDYLMDHHLTQIIIVAYLEQCPLSHIKTAKSFNFRLANDISEPDPDVPGPEQDEPRPQSM